MVTTVNERSLEPDALADPKALKADKADKLKQLMKRKPGQKGYKRSLKAFLEADAKFEKHLIKRLKLTDGTSSKDATPPA